MRSITFALIAKHVFNTVGVNRMSEPTYRWNDEARRYISTESGRFVTQAQTRQAVDGVIAAAKVDTAYLHQSLIEGRISVGDWQRQMAEEMRNLHTSMAAAAKGGWEQMTPSDWGRVGYEIRPQYEALQRMALDIESGRVPLDGRIGSRANQYIGASRGTYEEMKRVWDAQAGYDEERAVLGAADHCQECVDRAAEGWVEIGTLEPIGSLQCAGNCQCSIITRRSNRVEAIAA